MVALLAVGGTAHAQAPAQPDPPRATIVVVGDAERLNIGQDGYCGQRTEIAQPSNARFRIPAGRQTFLYIKSKFVVPTATYYCEGNFSFTPEASKLHIVRFTLLEGACQIEHFRAVPGATPETAPLTEELTRSCLGR